MEIHELTCVCVGVCVCGKGCSLYARHYEALPSQ